MPSAREPSALPDASSLPDVQGSADARRVAIDKVGVKDVRYPIRLRTPDGGTQQTVADVNMYVDLPAERKGTHMSRFLELLNESGEALTPEGVVALCRTMRDRLSARCAHIEMEFPYFIRRYAPVTGAPGLLDYRVRFRCEAGEKADFILGVTAPATSLCPCSREISEFGAHNQRCLIGADVRFTGALWIEDLVTLAEESASCAVYPVLKRPDEKFVTEAAFLNPKFVEDTVRDLALALEKDARITWYSVRSENFESIHGHNAYAEITRLKSPSRSRPSQP